MNQDALIRQIKIDMITNEPNPIIDWFNKFWTIIKIEYKKNADVYNSYDAIVFVNDRNTQQFYYSYAIKNVIDRLICENYKINVQLHYKVVCSVIKLLVENKINSQVEEASLLPSSNRELELHIIIAEIDLKT